MALIYLRHPRHGLKIATMELEAEHDAQHGWERYNPNEPVSEPQPEPEPAPVVNELPRRGRPRRSVELGV